MQLFMFTVFDEKAHAFYPPWVMMTPDMAVREFSQCVNDREHKFGMNPSDYTLFCVGEFDDAKGEVSTVGKRSLGNGLEFVKGFSTEVTESSIDDYERRVVDAVHDAASNGDDTCTEILELNE